MPFNGSGTFSPYTPGNPVVTGTVISSTAFNATQQDLAAGLSNAVTRDGQSPLTANLPAAGRKITGLGAGVVAGDSLRFEQLFSQGTEQDIASAATTDIGGLNTTIARITGTTTITSFGTNYNGPRYVRFAGALLLTHNATTLILPGGANITTAAGDRAILTPVGNPASGWQVLAYEVAALAPGTASSAATLSGTVAIANGGTGQTTAAGIQSILPIAQTRVDVASATTVNLTTSVPSNDHINITGTTTITSFTVASGRLFFVRFNGSLTLTNNGAIVTQTGGNITTRAGDTCIIRAIAANNVEVLSYTTGATQSRAASGYQVLSGGLILQWGTGNTGASSAISVTFPIAFPSACYHASAVVNQAGNPNAFMSASGLSTTSFTAASSTTTGGQPNIAFLWFAIGY